MSYETRGLAEDPDLSGIWKVHSKKSPLEKGIEGVV
jgi:hypothetical protein